MPRDQDLLLKYGFEYGMMRESMFGQDKDGNTWQVATIRMRPNQTGGYFGRTVWYKIDERGLRHKCSEAMSEVRFYSLFGERG
jgi:hypothetical protein